LVCKRKQNSSKKNIVLQNDELSPEIIQEADCALQPENESKVTAVFFKNIEELLSS
jgi:hypothetical protein